MRSLPPGAVAAIVAVAFGLRVADRELDDARVPLLGVLAAFVFAAQMLNFPVAGGTSGHFLGATLAAILLGPWVACLVMAVVIATQALAFADGGVTALGANVVNMGVLGALLAGFAVAGVLRVLGSSRAVLLGAAAVVSWVAVMAGAAATSVELAVSGTVPLGTALPAMLGVHAADRRRRGGDHGRRGERGAREPARPDRRGALRAARRCAVRPAGRGRSHVMSRLSVRAFTVLAVLLALALATAVSPFASSSPDGLERVAEDKAFLDQGRLHAVQEDAPVPDYAFPGVTDARVATGLAGLVGRARRVRAGLRPRGRRAATARAGVVSGVGGHGHALAGAGRRPRQPGAPARSAGEDRRAGGGDAGGGHGAAGGVAGVGGVRCGARRRARRVARVRFGALWRRVRVVLPLVLAVGVLVPFVRPGGWRVALGPVTVHEAGAGGLRRRGRQGADRDVQRGAARRHHARSRPCCAGWRRCGCRGCSC